MLHNRRSLNKVSIGMTTEACYNPNKRSIYSSIVIEALEMVS